MSGKEENASATSEGLVIVPLERTREIRRALFNTDDGTAERIQLKHCSNGISTRKAVRGRPTIEDTPLRDRSNLTGSIANFVEKRKKDKLSTSSEASELMDYCGAGCFKGRSDRRRDPRPRR